MPTGGLGITALEVPCTLVGQSRAYVILSNYHLTGFSNDEIDVIHRSAENLTAGAPPIGPRTAAKVGRFLQDTPAAVDLSAAVA